MLLKTIYDGKETPFEIDTAKEANGKRWVQLWRGKKCISRPKSVDEALDEIEEIMKEEDCYDGGKYASIENWSWGGLSWRGNKK